MKKPITEQLKQTAEAIRPNTSDLERGKAALLARVAAQTQMSPYQSFISRISYRNIYLSAALCVVVLLVANAAEDTATMQHIKESAGRALPGWFQADTEQMDAPTNPHFDVPAPHMPTEATPAPTSTATNSPETTDSSKTKPTSNNRADRFFDAAAISQPAAVIEARPTSIKTKPQVIVLPQPHATTSSSTQRAVPERALQHASSAAPTLPAVAKAKHASSSASSTSETAQTVADDKKAAAAQKSEEAVPKEDHEVPTPASADLPEAATAGQQNKPGTPPGQQRSE